MNKSAGRDEFFIYGNRECIHWPTYTGCDRRDDLLDITQCNRDFWPQAKCCEKLDSSINVQEMLLLQVSSKSCVSQVDAKAETWSASRWRARVLGAKEKARKRLQIVHQTLCRPRCAKKVWESQLVKKRETAQQTQWSWLLRTAREHRISAHLNENNFKEK